MSTLRYADRAKKIKNTAVVNENPQERLMRELREENEKLKQLYAVGGGGLDAETLKDMTQKQKEVEEMERALQEMEKSFEVRLAEAKKQQEDTSRRRTAVAAHGSTLPEIVNLNEDKALTGRMRYSLPQGTTTIGSSYEPSESSSDSDDSDESSSNSEGSDEDDDENDEDDDEVEPDIVLLAEGICKNHARVENNNGRCVMYSEGDAAHQTFLNGVPLADLIAKKQASGSDRRMSVGVEVEGDGVVLKHGDRVIFGKSFFVFVIPSEKSAEIMIATGEVDYNMAKMEKTTHLRQSTMARVRGSLVGADAFFGAEVSGDAGGLSGLHPGLMGAFSGRSSLGFLGGQRAEQEELTKLMEEQMKELEAKDSEIRGKDKEIQELQLELEAARSQISKLRIQASGGIVPDDDSDAAANASRRTKITDVIEQTFQEAMSQLAAAEALLSTGMKASELKKEGGRLALCRRSPANGK
eukprot:TRINITY_DN12176_c1_g1_i1.p1 TRINITY_DN12176_c1_g1~~TRINITY_DN12176_c1_g1_i1.p1  ORF type:complete len:492 (+),score=121.34 TRINITY_DN12176_c1_g1_i1:71-1477(+)